jgi:hypothetical protein
MVPMHIVILAKLPLNSSFKVDRKALPINFLTSPSSDAPQATSSTMSLSNIDETIRAMWAQLNVIVTRNDQSFYDYGGSSLLAMQFLYQIVCFFFLFFVCCVCLFVH